VLTGTEGESPVLNLAPDTFTLLILDAPIVRESVEVESRALFSRVDPGEEGIMLKLRTPPGPKERLKLHFTYREGFPSSVVLLLTAQPGPVDEVVHVSRPQRGGETCREELSATRERCEAQARELEELKARPPALSPAAVALAGFVDKDGMKGKDFVQVCSKVPGDVRPTECWGLGGATSSVVVFEVSTTEGEPWAPAWAEVTPTGGGEPRRARAILTGQATTAGAVRVAVEVEMPRRKKPEEWLSAQHALRVCNADGSRCLSVSQVEL
jgi:uncharacterized protein (TIGR02268 family)